MQLNQKLLTVEGAEIASFPMPVMALTVGVDEGFHKGGFAIDNAGADTGKDPVIAPFTGKALKVDTTGGNAVIFESTNAVWQPGKDGIPVFDYLTMRYVHDDMPDVKQNVSYAQGFKIGDEGNAGISFGNHCHMSFARGKYKGIELSSAGYNKLIGEIPPWEAVFINGTIIKKSLNYPWKAYIPTGRISLPGSTAEALANDLRYRDRPDTSGKILGILPQFIKFPCVSVFPPNDGHEWLELVVEGQLVYAAKTYMLLHEEKMVVEVERPVNVDTVVDGLHITVKNVVK